MIPACPTTFALPAFVGMTLPARVARANDALYRRRVWVETELAALLLADPTRGYMTASRVGLRGWHFCERDAMALWTAVGFRRFAPRSEVLATAANCLRRCGLWDAGPEADARGPYPGVWRGMRWHWGALVGTSLAYRPDPARVRRLAVELLELDARQEAAARGLAYAARVLSGVSEKGANRASDDGTITEYEEAGREGATQAGVQRPPRRVVA